MFEVGTRLGLALQVQKSYDTTSGDEMASAGALLALNLEISVAYKQSTKVKMLVPILRKGHTNIGVLLVIVSISRGLTFMRADHD
jgi:hypothetical protein